MRKMIFNRPLFVERPKSVGDCQKDGKVGQWIGGISTLRQAREYHCDDRPAEYPPREYCERHEIELRSFCEIFHTTCPKCGFHGYNAYFSGYWCSEPLCLDCREECLYWQSEKYPDECCRNTETGRLRFGRSASRRVSEFIKAARRAGELIR